MTQSPRRSTFQYLPEIFPYFAYLWQILLSEMLMESRALYLVNTSFINLFLLWKLVLFWLITCLSTSLFSYLTVIFQESWMQAKPLKHSTLWEKVLIEKGRFWSHWCVCFTSLVNESSNGYKEKLSRQSHRTLIICQHSFFNLISTIVVISLLKGNSKTWDILMFKYNLQRPVCIYVQSMYRVTVSR